MNRLGEGNPEDDCLSWVVLCAQRPSKGQRGLVTDAGADGLFHAGRMCKTPGSGPGPGDPCTSPQAFAGHESLPVHAVGPSPGGLRSIVRVSLVSAS